MSVAIRAVGLALLLNLAAAPAFAQEAVLFKRTFTKGAVETTVSTSKMSISMGFMGESVSGEGTMRYESTMTVDEVLENGNAKITAKQSNFTGEMTVDGERSDFAESADEFESELTGTLTPFMRLIDFKVKEEETGGDEESPMLPGMEGPMTGIADAMALAQFPEKAVKPGETWKIQMPSTDGMMKEGQSIEGTFVGTQEWNGQQVYVLRYAGKLELDPEALKRAMGEGEDAAEMGEVKIEGAITTSGEMFVDPKTFSVLRSTSKVESESKMDMGGFAMEMRLGFDTETLLKR